MTQAGKCLAILEIASLAARAAGRSAAVRLSGAGAAVGCRVGCHRRR